MLSVLLALLPTLHGPAAAVSEPDPVHSPGPLAGVRLRLRPPLDEPPYARDLETALEASAADGRPVVIVFSAVWCPSCRRFKERTLASAAVLDAAEGFHWVLCDIDRQPSLAREYEVEGTPQVVVVNADRERLGTAVGALGVERFLAFLAGSARGDVGPRGPELDADVGELTWSPDGFRGRGICFSHVGYGPLDLPSQSPNQILRLGLRPRTPSTLAEGQWELFASETIANVFAFEEGSFRLDYLTLNSVVRVGYGLSDTVMVEASLRNLSRFDSVLDPLTTAFHDLFGLGDSGRDEFPDGDNVIEFEPGPDGFSLRDDTAGSESTDLAFAFQHNVTCGTELLPALSWSARAQVHLGGHVDLEGQSPWSYGLSGSAARRLGDEWYVYLGLDYTWHGTDEARGLELVEEQYGGLLAVEWRYAADCAWVMQYLTNEGVAVSREPFDDPTHELNLGWKRELQPGTVLEIGLIENIIEVDNSPDFGLHFGLRHRF